MASFAIVPGKSLGKLALGLPLPAVIAYLQRERHYFRKYELKFGDQAPFEHPIVLNLVDNGVALRFDPVSQRLASIEIYDFEPMVLTYEGVAFSSSSIIATFLLIYNTFGPTYPGEFDQEKLKYTLKYPGIAFVFMIPETFLSGMNSADLPITFPDGTTPVVSKMYIFNGPSLAETEVVKLGLHDIYYERVIVNPCSGLKFTLRGGSVELGATCQDVLAEIGKPEDIVDKKQGKMDIHRNTSDKLLMNPSYIWNYFSMGIDIVFDGTFHRVTKMILHTNMLGHHDVNKYAACNFDIVMGTQSDGRHIHSTAKWDDIKSMGGNSPLGPPVIFNQNPNHNPFGSTSYYALNNILFEIMKNGHIASITVY
ncbi:hypothetical protein BASA50_000957 [Batrachochytrium salamandrivorans]|uniref:Uncharacterized protein n=1 Tax=Batrachochytrium salamandrivorans TaxID=1357716 RepID=A0ABQ8EST7_9FUNG|nr:hypothetical protein BASA50_000957 [Batrachochytrium salamandrivorans]KAH9275694.1 hypothetical protein BASA83_001994 [Batrachochytrium salamandrivorans]